MNLSAPFIARPVATALLMAALALLGIAAFPLLPVAPLPQVDFPTVQVTATLAGASADTMPHLPQCVHDVLPQVSHGLPLPNPYEASPPAGSYRRDPQHTPMFITDIDDVI